MADFELASMPVCAAAGVPEEYIRAARNPNDKGVLALYRAGIPASYVAACGRLRPAPPHHDEIIELHNDSGTPESYVRALQPISFYAVQTYWTLGLTINELREYGLWAVEPNTVRRLHSAMVPVEYSLPLLVEGFSVPDICRLFGDGVAIEYALATVY